MSHPEPHEVEQAEQTASAEQPTATLVVLPDASTLSVGDTVVVEGPATVVQQAEQQASPVDPEDSEEAEDEAWEARLPAKTRRSKNLNYVGRGRPSKFRRWMLPIITRLAARNSTEADIAERLRISPAQFSVWKRENSRIAKALSEGQEMALDYVEQALLRRAIGWSGPTEKVLRDGRVVRHKQFHPPDAQAAIAVLTNRRSDRWKRNLEGNQPLGIQVVINNPRISAALKKHAEIDAATQQVTEIAPTEQD